MPDDSLVHIVDDDDAMRDSLSFMLSAAGYAARVYDNAETFLVAAEIGARACVITDVRMPGKSGIELIAALRDRCGDAAPPVIVITGHGDVQMAVAAMKAGARDFLEKPFEEVALLHAVQQALTARAADDLRAQERIDVQRRIESLSGREKDVLDGLVHGSANKVIAADLGISPRTVEIYRANLMTKMRATSLSDLVRMALLAGVG